MPPLIRDAAPDDLARLEELEKRCFSVPWTRQTLLSQLPDETHVFLVAEESGQIKGYVNLVHVLDEGYIGNVAVDPAARRQGLGRALIAALMQRAAALGLSFVTLEVRESNQTAIALYSGFGFERVGLRKNYYESPRENAVLMTCYLK